MLTIKVRSKNRSRVEQSWVKIASVCSMVFHLTLPWGRHPSCCNSNCNSSPCGTQYNLNMLIGCGNLVVRQPEQSSTEQANRLGRKWSCSWKRRGSRLMCMSSCWSRSRSPGYCCCCCWGVSLIGFGFGFLVIAFLAPHCVSRQCCPPPTTTPCCYCCNCVLAINFVYWWVSCCIAGESEGEKPHMWHCSASNNLINFSLHFLAKFNRAVDTWNGFYNCLKSIECVDWRKAEREGGEREIWYLFKLQNQFNRNHKVTTEEANRVYT